MPTREPTLVGASVPAGSGETTPVRVRSDLILLNLILCQQSPATSAASSPRESFSRSPQEDLSCVPPEEPEWLAKFTARAHPRPGVPRSRSGSRRNSAVITTPLVRAGGAPFPSPLRNTVSAVLISTDGVEGGREGGGGGSTAASPSPFSPAHPEALYDRFGSVEGLSAAVDDFYHRLCADEHIGAAIREVPEPDVRYIMMQLMALSLEEGATPHPADDRLMWFKHCSQLLQQAGAHADFSADAVSLYEAVTRHMLATLATLGVCPDGDAAWHRTQQLGSSGSGEGSSGSDPARLSSTVC